MKVGESTFDAEDDDVVLHPRGAVWQVSCRYQGRRVVVDPPERDAVGRYGVRLDGVPSRHGRHWFAADCLAPEVP